MTLGIVSVRRAKSINSINDDAEVTGLSIFVSRSMVISDSWQGIVDAGRDNLDPKVQRLLTWTTAPQSREYMNMERRFDELHAEYWSAAVLSVEEEEE